MMLSRENWKTSINGNINFRRYKMRCIKNSARIKEAMLLKRRAMIF